MSHSCWRLRWWPLQAWSFAANKHFDEKAKFLGISLGLAVLYQKDCTRWTVPEAVQNKNFCYWRQKENSSFFLLIPVFYVLCCLLCHPETGKSWKLRTLERTQVDCFDICRNSSYQQLQISSLYSSSRAFPVSKYLLSFPTRDKMCMFRGDLTLEQGHDTSPERMQNAIWKSTPTLLSKLYHFGLPCKSIHLPVSLASSVDWTYPFYYTSTSNISWLSHVEDRGEKKEKKFIGSLKLITEGSWKV